MNYTEFVNDYLVPLADPESPDRATLADFRRGLSDYPNLPPIMHRHIMPRIPTKLDQWGKQIYYLTASLFALHLQNGGTGNMGSHFHTLLDPKNPDANTPIERRFTYLLAAHPEELHFHLRQVVSFLKAKEVEINWVQLMWDLKKWGDQDSRMAVQEKWASQFWRASKIEQTESESQN